jgi:hypothetical protein
VLTTQVLILYTLVQEPLALASAVIARSKSCRTHDCILLSHLRLNSLFVASYDARSCGGGIPARLHTGHYFLLNTHNSLAFNFLGRSVGRSVSLYGVRPPSGAHDHFYFSPGKLFSEIAFFPFRMGCASLTRGWVCNLVRELLVLASNVTHGSKSHRTLDHILLSHLRLGSLFVASYDSPSYGGGILFCLHYLVSATAPVI